MKSILSDFNNFNPNFHKKIYRRDQNIPFTYFKWNKLLQELDHSLTTISDFPKKFTFLNRITNSTTPVSFILSGTRFKANIKFSCGFLTLSTLSKLINNGPLKNSKD